MGDELPDEVQWFFGPVWKWVELALAEANEYIGGIKKDVAARILLLADRSLASTRATNENNCRRRLTIFGNR